MFKERSWCRATLGERSNPSRGGESDVSVLSEVTQSEQSCAAFNTHNHFNISNTAVSEDAALLIEGCDIDCKTLMLRGGEREDEGR